MSDDPQLLKKVRGWKAAGATDDELADLIAEYEYAHRFADPNLPASVAGSRERLQAGPELGGMGDERRQESGGEALLGGIGEAAKGFSLGFSDEFGGALAGAGALLPGGKSPGEAYRQTRDVNRKFQRGFEQEHPGGSVALNIAGGALNPLGRIKSPVTAGKVAGTGALIGGAYGLGTGEGSVEDQLKSTAFGAATGAVLPTAAYGIGKGVGKAAPSIARVFGYTSAKGQAAAADKMIQQALEATGQTQDDVFARIAAAAQAGKPLTFAEALGPAADDALAQMGPLGTAMRGEAFQASEALAERAPKLAKRIGKVAAKQPPAPMNVGEFAGMAAGPLAGAAVGGPVGAAIGGAASLAFSPLARRVATAGIRKATRGEHEALMRRLLETTRGPSPKAPGSGIATIPPPPPRVEARITESGPISQPSIPERLRLAPGPRLGQPVPERRALMPGSGETIGKIVPQEDIERQALEALLLGEQPKAAMASFGPTPKVVPNYQGQMPSESMIARRVAKIRKDVASRKPNVVDPSETNLRLLAEHLADPANQDENLETLLQLSLLKGKGKAGGSVPRPFDLGESGRIGPSGKRTPDDLAEELDALAQRVRDAAPPGSKFEPFLTTSGEVKLGNIQVPKEARGQGAGNRMMRELLDWADQNDLPISLDPRPDPGKKAALQKFYRELGFRPASSSRSYHPESHGEWYRSPKSGKSQGLATVGMLLGTGAAAGGALTGVELLQSSLLKPRRRP